MLGSYNTSELSCQAKNWRKVERIKMNFPLIQWWFFHPHMYFREVMWPLASRGQCSSLNDVRLASPALRARKHPCPRIPRPPEQTFEVLPKHIFPEYKSYGLVSLDSFWVLPLKQKHFHKMESQSLYGNMQPYLIVNNVFIIWGCWDGPRITENHSSIIMVANLGFLFWVGFFFNCSHLGCSNKQETNETTCYHSASLSPQPRPLYSCKEAYPVPEQRWIGHLY